MASTSKPAQRTIWKFMKAVGCPWQTRKKKTKAPFVFWFDLLWAFGSLRKVCADYLHAEDEPRHASLLTGPNSLLFTPLHFFKWPHFMCSAWFFVRKQSLVGHNSCCCQQRSLLLGELKESHGFFWLPRFCRTPGKANIFWSLDHRLGHPGLFMSIYKNMFNVHVHTIHTNITERYLGR